MTQEALAGVHSRAVPDAADGSPLVRQLMAVARRCPDALAVSGADGAFTYDHLARRALQIARTLNDAGLRRGDVVAVRTGKSAQWVAAMLGILVAGGVYLPLDPDNAPQLQEQLLRRSSARFDLQHAHRPLPTPSGVLRLVLEDVGGEPLAYLPPGCDDSPAYLLFTSGSSGQPKGVTVSHGNLRALLAWVAEGIGAPALAAGATVTSAVFDPSFVEVLGPLSVGGSVTVVAGPQELSTDRSDVTFFATTPSVLAEMVRLRLVPRSTTTVLVGGEVLGASVVSSVFAATGVERIVHAYGPTEATVMVTAQTLTRGRAADIAIGAELPGTRIHVVGEHGPVADGMVGELVVTGRQVALGYLGDGNRSGAFARRAVDGGTPQWSYATGDLGRRRPDGQLEFVGRRDFQIKLRGMRIDLAQVRDNVERLPAVEQAHVLAVGEGGSATLVGFVVLADAPAQAWDGETAREALRGMLPSYAVPSRLLAVPRIPLTPTGKTDERALRALADGVAPGSASRLADLGLLVARNAVAEVAGVEPADDDDLTLVHGLSSLTLMRVAAIVRREVGQDLDLAAFFGRPTLTTLAAAVGRQPSSVLRLNADAPGTALVLFSPYLGSLEGYRRLAAGLQRPVLLVVCQTPAQQEALTSIEAMARYAVDQLEGVLDGPATFAGHSAGGLVAIEAAAEALARGVDVRSLLVLDTPAIGGPLRYVWGEAVLNAPELLSARKLPTKLRAVWLKRRPAGLGGNDPDRRLDRASAARDLISNAAVRNYRLRPFPGRVDLVTTRQGRVMAGGRADLGWRDWAATVPSVVRVPGGHTSMFHERHVGAVAARVQELLDAGLAG